jgi:hypothetical protein
VNPVRRYGQQPKKRWKIFSSKTPCRNQYLLVGYLVNLNKKEMEKDVKCPYCDFEQNINHDDDRGYVEGILHHQQCCNCEKSFAFTTTLIFNYDAIKADCLNDGKHQWRPTKTYPKIATKMECFSCGEKRRPTKEEMELILEK